MRIEHTNTPHCIEYVGMHNKKSNIRLNNISNSVSEKLSNKLKAHYACVSVEHNIV